MQNLASDLADLHALAEALSQYVDNDEKMQEIRAEEGLPEIESVTRARAMLDRVNARLVALLDA